MVLAGTVLSITGRHVDLNQDPAQMSLSVKPAPRLASAVSCPAFCRYRLKSHIGLVLVNVCVCDCGEVLAALVSRGLAQSKSVIGSRQLIPSQYSEGRTNQ